MTAARSIAVIVPALNAAPTLPIVVAGIRASLPRATVIGIDDGSTDQTRAVMQAACDEVIVHEVNQGKGVALKAGFKAALSRGADAVVTIDSDGQHDPTVAPALVEALDRFDIVVGTRQRGGTRMPFHRRISNALSTRAISWCAGCEIQDAQSGYRAIRADVLRKVDPPGTRYEYETAFLIRAGQAGFRIGAVSIPTIYGAPSYFRALQDAQRIIRTIWENRPGASKA